MQEAEEQDTCRICSAPAEPDQPLFHPCKCSGTIRYIHQDCLTTWLAHSKKKTCDVCKYPYSFTKVYAADMPATLPFLLVLRRLIQQGFYALIMFIRAIIVAMVWLSIVPLLTVWSWRMYFSAGDATARWVSNRLPIPAQNVSQSSDLHILPQLVEFAHFYFNESTPPPANASLLFLGRIVKHPAWLSLSADIFTGQIIAALIVITFVAIFLLREWIAQNARPGFFEDEENPAGQQQQQDILQVPPALQQQIPAPPPRPAAQRLDVNARLALAHRQIEAVRALDALREERPLTEEEKLAREARARTLGRSSIEFAPPRSETLQEELDRFASMRASKRRAEKGKEKEAGDVENEDDEEDIRAQQIQLERMKRRNFTRRLAAARQSGNRRRQDQRPADPGMAIPNLDIPLETNTQPSSRTPPSPSSFFPAVALERPSGSIPFSFVFPPPNTETELTSTSSAISSASSNDVDESQDSTFSTESSLSPPVSPDIFIAQDPDSATILSASRPGTPIRRPPLPTTLTATSSSSISVSGSSSPKIKTPLASPSLATYRAPEELANLGNEDYFASSSSTTLEDLVAEEEVEEEEDDDTETLDGHETAEDYSDALLPLPQHDGPNMDEEMRNYFRDAEMGAETEAGDESDDGGSDVEIVAAPPPLWEPPAVIVDEEEEEEDDDDEEEEDGEEEVAEEFQDPERLRVQPPIRAAVAFEAGPGLRRLVEIDDGLDAPAAPAPRLGIPQIQAPPQAPQDPAAEEGLLMDDIEAGVEDDMDGAMEAIGLRGPIYGLIQNAALMVFIMDSVIGLGIWVPYTLGKSVALLMVEPRQLLFVLHLPIRAIRIVTDPAVDLVAYTIMDLLLPMCLRIVQSLVINTLVLLLWIVRESFGSAAADKAQQICFATCTHLEVFLQPVLRVLGFVEVPSEEIVTFASEAVPAPSFLSETLSTFIDLVEPYFAPLGRGLREDYVKFAKLWIGLATNDGPVERIFSVVFGYCILASIIALYLNILTVGNAKTAGRAVRKAVEQQLLVFKVATFIFIELVTFPLGCGVILDMCTLWLFPNSSYTSRMEFFYQAPLTSTFYHWVSGTMFMYSFAVLLSGCRSIMRPGAMWFIKDPQDQNAHPIRDILERNTLVQFRKILISGVMYSFIVAGAVGTVAALLFLGQQFVLPFRWKTREPLSNVPIDLLFLNLALPYTMTYFRPRKAIRKFTIVVWKELSRRLRLSSYFFGKRYGEEEYTPKTWSLGRTIYGPTKDADVVAADYDGSFRRVPNTDDIALPREMRATVAVTAAGDPVDEAASKLMTEQNEVTTKVNRNVKQDFIVVYIPPYFRYRMILFVSMLWSVGALCAGISLVLPVLLGRGFFGIIFKGKREVHDGYSILAGFYMLWACWIAGKAVDRLDKRRQRWGSEGPRASLWWLAVKRGLLWFVKASYMAIFLGLVIPTLVGCVVELYVTLPFKLHLSQDIGVPRIRVLDCWATGLLYTKIVIRVIRRQGHGQNPISRGLQVIKRNGWTHPDPITATKDVIGPVAGGLTGMILLPALIFYAIHFFFPLVGRYVEDKFLFAYVYSGLFCLAGLIHTFSVLREMLASWSQSVRDKEFLVEMRLRNHDPMPPSGTPTPVSTNAISNQLAR